SPCSVCYRRGGRVFQSADAAWSSDGPGRVHPVRRRHCISQFGSQPILGRNTRTDSRRRAKILWRSKPSGSVHTTRGKGQATIKTDPMKMRFLTGHIALTISLILAVALSPAGATWQSAPQESWRKTPPKGEAPRPFKPPTGREITFDNGLSAILVEDH